MHKIPGLSLGDLLYVLERICLGLTRLDIFHLYLDRLVHQGQLFLLDHPFIGKDSLSDDLSLASGVAFLKVPESNQRGWSMFARVRTYEERDDATLA